MFAIDEEQTTMETEKKERQPVLVLVSKTVCSDGTEISFFNVEMREDDV